MNYKEKRINIKDNTLLISLFCITSFSFISVAIESDQIETVDRPFSQMILVTVDMVKLIKRQLHHHY